MNSDRRQKWKKLLQLVLDNFKVFTIKLKRLALIKNVTKTVCKTDNNQRLEFV